MENLTFIAIAIAIVTGFAGNALYSVATHRAAAMRDRIEIRGYWGEFVPHPAIRQFSIGEIRYDFVRRMWTFDGTNFNNDGTPYCDWVTIASHLDATSHRLYYVFTNTMHDEAHVAYVGFGSISLGRMGGKWVPTRGFFVSGSHGEVYRTHSMVPLESIPLERAERVRVFESLLREPVAENVSQEATSVGEF